MKKYTFKFTELAYGTITLECEEEPPYHKVVDAIRAGNGEYKEFEYDDIDLILEEKMGE